MLGPKLVINHVHRLPIGPPQLPRARTKCSSPGGLMRKMLILIVTWWSWENWLLLSCFAKMEMHGKYESGNEEEDNDEVHDQILMFFLLKDCSSLKASPPNDGYLASFILPFKPLQDQNRCHYHQCHYRHHLYNPINHYISVTLIVGLPPRLISFWSISSQILHFLPAWMAGWNN